MTFSCFVKKGTLMLPFYACCKLKFSWPQDLHTTDPLAGKRPFIVRQKLHRAIWFCRQNYKWNNAKSIAILKVNPFSTWWGQRPSRIVLGTVKWCCHLVYWAQCCQDEMWPSTSITVLKVNLSLLSVIILYPKNILQTSLFSVQH